MFYAMSVRLPIPDVFRLDSEQIYNPKNTGKMPEIRKWFGFVMESYYLCSAFRTVLLQFQPQ